MKTPIVVCCGAGVNTVGMLCGLRERHIVPDLILFSDTRGEKPETYAYLASVLVPWLRDVRFPELVTICRADFSQTKTGDPSLEAECLRLGTLPSRAYGYGTCADKWKIDPFKWFMKTWEPAVSAWSTGRVVVRMIGYDAHEESRVSTVTDPGYVKRYPLIEWGWDREDCEAVIERHGLAIPPKSACFYCPSSTREEILALGKRSPELATRAVTLERRALATGRWNVKGLGRRFAWGDLLEASEEEQRKFPEAPVEDCGVCVVQ